MSNVQRDAIDALSIRLHLHRILQISRDHFAVPIDKPVSRDFNPRGEREVGDCRGE